jgi:CDGSH-type Zn-finger protein
MVKRTASAPMKIEVGGEVKWICACGLSNKQPFCDGSHKSLGTAEEGAQLCWYDSAGKRHSCDGPFADSRSW